MFCKDCGRTLRPYGQLKKDWPHTVAAYTADRCQRCHKVFKAGLAQRKRVPEVRRWDGDDNPTIPVKVMLSPYAYKIISGAGLSIHSELFNLANKLAKAIEESGNAR